MGKRKDHEPPPAISKKGMRYHHLGIPTAERKPDEVYLKEYKFYFSGFKTSEYGIEWMRFEKDSPISDLIKRVPHIAFEVDDLEAALSRLGVASEITSPSEGVRVAMIVDDGAPVELIEFRRRADRPR